VAFALTQSKTIKSHAFDVENTTLSSEEAFKVATMEHGPTFAGLKQTHIEKQSALDVDDKFHDGVPFEDKQRCETLQCVEEAMHLAELE
jgi:hypothetical protein